MLTYLTHLDPSTASLSECQSWTQQPPLLCKKSHSIKNTKCIHKNPPSISMLLIMDVKEKLGIY